MIRPQRTRPAARGVAVLVLALALVATSRPAVGDEATWRLDRATSSIGFDPGLLRAFGFEVAEVDTTAAPYAPGSRFLRFTSEAPDALELRAPDGLYRGVGAGELRHRGGFVLRFADGSRVDLHGFVVSAASDEGYDLAIRSATGELLFRTTNTHPNLDRRGGRALFLNADLRIAPELAERLGEPRLADLALAQFDLEARLDDRGAPQLAPCNANYAQPNDVELTFIGSMGQRAAISDGKVALAGNATLVNNGPGDVQWEYAIAPDANPGPHPFLSQALYRIGADGVLRMIGLADVKHAFYSVNFGCSCDGGHVLYAGCGDTYSEGNNDNRYYLAPRDEVTAHTASWTSLGSHFDVYPAEPEDDYRSHGGNASHDSFEHRLVVNEADLDLEGARYLIELWYVVANDSNPWNNVAWREFDPAKTTSWTFSSVGSTTAGPAIDEWVDPVSPGDHEASTTVDTGEGRFKLASRATEIEGGWRYDYAMLNFDFDRRISGFSVPVGPSSGAGDPVFRGAGLAAPAVPWTPTLDTTTVHWDAGAGDALDWGTLFGFSFTSPYPPKRARATLDAFEAGSPADYEAQVVAPAELIFADGFESGDTSAWALE